MYQYRITHKHWNSSTTFHNFHTKEEAANSAKEALLNYYALRVDAIDTTWENEDFRVEIEAQFNQQPNE